MIVARRAWGTKTALLGEKNRCFPHDFSPHEANNTLQRDYLRVVFRQTFGDSEGFGNVCNPHPLCRLGQSLHWAETHPVEWRKVVSRVPTTDCLIIGRTDAAFQTHPQALQQTERIINAVFAHLLGQAVDLGGGSRGFSRQAAPILMTHSVRSQAWCVDSERVMLLHQAGFEVEYIAVNGLESPEYFVTYDAEAGEFRVKVTLDIIQSGLATAQKAF